MLPTRRASPVLVCLNLQRAYTDPLDRCYAPRGATALVHAGACVAWARRQSLPVWHVHTRVDGARSMPIPGFEPRPNERVLMKQSWSLFDSAEVARARPALHHAFVLGFTAAKDCVASAIDAERAGVRLAFVTDAIASSALANQSADVVDDVLASLLGEWATSVTTAELLRREPQLVASGETGFERQ
ncbi:MAG: isochorismatase family protein [Hyphomonadaceae bacterium]|jgi:nicotinamidase-related amidase|nr:isochorismatase family protein [Hyphomonadaceae bacterium]